MKIFITVIARESWSGRIFDSAVGIKHLRTFGRSSCPSFIPRTTLSVHGAVPIEDDHFLFRAAYKKQNKFNVKISGRSNLKFPKLQCCSFVSNPENMKLQALNFCCGSFLYKDNCQKNESMTWKYERDNSRNVMQTSISYV